MALDIRLDFIGKVNPTSMDEMKIMRKLYIDIDDKLKQIADVANELKDAAAARCVALARTYNEQACQSTIKTLCLLGEVK